MTKKIILPAMASTIAAVSFSVPASATNTPVMTIGAPSIDYAVNGDTIAYEVIYSEDTTDIDLREGAVGLNGFTGNVSISGEGNTRTVTVSDIAIDTEFDERGYGEIYITINSGTGFNENIDLSNGVRSEPTLVANHPYMTLQQRSDSVDEGGTMIFDVLYRGGFNEKIARTFLSYYDIGKHHFEGNVFTQIIDDEHAVITITDIVGSGNDNFISINGGTSIGNLGNGANERKGKTFTINDLERPVMTMSKPYASADGKSVRVDLMYSDDDIAGISLKEDMWDFTVSPEM